MKTKLSILFLCFLLILSGNANLFAQVTIGVGAPPEGGALLDLKEKDAANPTQDVTSLENSTKGVLHPKVFLRDAAKLTPLYGGSDNGSGVWSDGSTAEEKLKATGMVVYNVNPDAINMDEGLYMWQIDEWVKLNQDGAAIIQPVNCSAIRINGSYIEGTPVNDNNYLEIDLNVTKKGSFAISVLSGNGYSFYYTGVALDTGTLTVKVPAQGTPALAGENTLTFSGISLTPGCEPKITVQEMVAAYTMVCSSAVVQGQFFKGQTLTASNVIRMNINVSQPGSYNIYTETKNGISFKDSGSFASTGTQTITLVGTGIPTVNEDFQVVIKANTSLGSVQCSALIPIILPDMTYAIIGDGIWSWDAAPRTNTLSNAGSASFSPNGLVRIKSFKQLWSTSSTSTATTNLTNGVNGGKYPDVVLYFAYGADPTSGLTTALLNYINAGGCVIYGSSDNTATAVNTLMSGLFGISPAQNQTGGGDDNVYPIANNSSDPIINGPFGNLAGMYWGEDNTSNYSIVMSSLPPNSVQICTALSTSKPGIDPSISIVWYNNSKNFVYFGDSTGASTSDTTTGAYPAIYRNNLPASKLYGPGTDDNRYVYNAALELNAVSFMLRRAAVSGINPY
ncbi:MAG: hypothetical protein ACK5KN_12075 [Dysgonomonas sp.]|uniref:hypothetical protein n=1 Tax=Dysgonomonas sp. TaxID=1891233 RepID=UPI0028279F1F|nr:hypothetical protein [Prevotella sp.]